jgi:Flp pilus assembly protein TadG
MLVMPLSSFLNLSRLRPLPALAEGGRVARPANGRIGRLLRTRRGATALEFAILSLPAMLFLLFLFELGLDFYVQLALDYAVQEGARRLQTGAGNAAPSAAAFKADCMCPPVAAFLNCNQITVTVYPLTAADYYLNAQSGAGSVPMAGGVLSTSAWSFSTSGAATPMFIQAIYTSVSAIGLLLPSMSVSTGSSRVHVTTSSIGFINEPFGTSTSVCGVGT